MNRNLFIVGSAAVALMGAAFAGYATAQDFRGRGPIIINPPQQQLPQFQAPQQRGPQFQAPQGRPQQPRAQVQAQRPAGNGNANSLLNAFDTNKDGTLTQDEINTARAERLKAFDKNGDGKLSLEEYAALWLDAMHLDMVRQFQRHDTSGDAQVTVEEFDAQYKDAVKRLDANGDGKLNADDTRRPVVQQAVPAPRQQQAPAQRPGVGPGPRRGAPTVAPGIAAPAPAGQAI